MWRGAVAEAAARASRRSAGAAGRVHVGSAAADRARAPRRSRHHFCAGTTTGTDGALRGGCPGPRGRGVEQGRSGHGGSRPRPGIPAPLPERAAHGDREDGRRNQVNARRGALPIAWALIAANALPAIAQDRASPSSGHVELEVEGCPTVPTAAVRRVLGIEIGDLLLEPSTGEVQDVDRLIIRCAGNFAAVEATGISGGAATERILRLDDFPGDAAPRALALLGVELLAARSAAVRERILRRRT